MAKREPLTVAEARAALREAGEQVGKKGRLSAEAMARAEQLTGRKFAR